MYVLKSAHFCLRTTSLMPKQGSPSQGSRPVLKTVHFCLRTGCDVGLLGCGACRCACLLGWLGLLGPLGLGLLGVACWTMLDLGLLACWVVLACWACGVGLLGMPCWACRACVLAMCRGPGPAGPAAVAAGPAAGPAGPARPAGRADLLQACRESGNSPGPPAVLLTLLGHKGACSQAEMNSFQNRPGPLAGRALLGHQRGCSQAEMS